MQVNTKSNTILNSKNEPMSEMRKIYFIRLIGRVILLILSVFTLVYKPEYFNVLEGMNFFKSFSPLHILWLIWIIDMILKLFPSEDKISIGSQKMFAKNFIPTKNKVDYVGLRKHIITANKSAFKVLMLWALLVAVFGTLNYTNVLSNNTLFILTILAYVCDLFCILIWCPFRAIMKNRCCVTCHIFNWDHLMIFSPLIFVGGFYSISLICIASVMLVIWEIAKLKHPERFWEKSNEALTCSECTDKLCSGNVKK